MKFCCERRHWIVALGLSLLATTGLATSGLAQTGVQKFTMADARKAALTVENGRIKSQELEKEKGRQIYSFDIVMPDGLHEVNIDAVTGKVVEDTIETAKDEAKEAAEDTKAKKGVKKNKAVATSPQ
jgi:hypothetical protein